LSQPCRSERQSSTELKRSRSASPENLSCARSRLAIIRLIEYVAVSRQVGDIKNVEAFCNQRKRNGLVEGDLSSQSQILRYEGIPIRKSRRQSNRVDNLVEWSAWPDYSHAPVRATNPASTRFNVQRRLQFHLQPEHENPTPGLLFDMNLHPTRRSDTSR